MRIPIILAIWLILIAPTSCRHRVGVATPTKVIGPGFAYIEQRPGDFIVSASNNEGLKRAMQAIGCGLCTSDSAGIIMRVKLIKAK